MNILAATARLATLVLIASAGSAAFAQTAATTESGMVLALNEKPATVAWESSVAATDDSAQASVERELAISAQVISEKLNEELEARMARKLQMAI